MGTDASMAQHVSNVIRRGFVHLDESSRRLTPAPLGLALVHAMMLIDEVALTLTLTLSPTLSLKPKSKPKPTPTPKPKPKPKPNPNPKPKPNPTLTLTPGAWPSPPIRRDEPPPAG